MAAFGFLFVTILSISLSALSILSSNLVSSTWKLQFGSALEMLLLAFSLSDRFNVIRLEKEKAQTNLLQTQQLLVENLKLSEHILEARVLERTKELEIVNLQLKALSTTDALTGIANRRHFDDVLAVEWERAKRQNKPLALGLLDVDWFKKYNDHYGHQMGDECLKNVAAVLKSSICRTGDLVARYGGEEFVFIAPATDCNAALKMAQKIREEFEKRALPHELSDFGFVSASIGITCVIPNENLQSKDLVKIADEALYLAKEQGRNRVVAKINENEITLTG
jgi:diguanylate cyclase (GGDEF)-like protein